MVRVGVHVSIAGSLDLAVDRAKDAGCDVFQQFSRNPRGWGFKPLSDDDCAAYKAKIKATGIIPVDHMPYLPNLASPKPEIYEKSVPALAAELARRVVARATAGTDAVTRLEGRFLDTRRLLGSRARGRGRGRGGLT